MPALGPGGSRAASATAAPDCAKTPRHRLALLCSAGVLEAASKSSPRQHGFSWGIRVPPTQRLCFLQPPSNMGRMFLHSVMGAFNLLAEERRASSALVGSLAEPEGLREENPGFSLTGDVCG